ncbi:PIKK family atypical protein kinase [Trichomonas vaginalis G3]|uniref:non-specific serine/threonine protein kinase n=1 Tax=Trichomonas vaginalis (strain ATCC PRA-98 / G3) TaxID=412133 RepID=A2F9M3_TRIV3|nr:ataxia telangiectasia mutated (ATM) -related family [Trichomonas vaginalis G3]EAX98404.1 PIKK family atypical protein kinase [Trichomonas vaginalis G3]KAI5486589.1 ataxia telangiectasia mutated (ATM) -related family [Trichomonas vaginalis G3]|eukprot:XP_001311334.1 PIKK family atypical protein kinase [Trichomonas vaginalis G3]
MSKDTNDEIHFFNEVFSALSFQQLEQNSLLCIVLLSELMTIDIGDKILRANKIGEDLINLPAATSTLYWKRYQKILLWLHRTLGQSFQLILSQLYEKMLIWFDDDKEVEVIAGLSLLSIFAQCFTSLLYSSPKSLETAIEKILISVTTNSFNVRLASQYTLRSILQTTPISFAEQLCEYFIEPFESHDPNDAFSGIAECLSIIIEERPEMKQYLKFHEVPYYNLSSFVANLRLSSYLALPVAIKTTPELFTPDVWLQIFEKFKILLTTEIPDLKKATSSFIDIIFLKNGELTEAQSVPIKELCNYLLEHYETENKICTLIAVSSLLIDRFDEIFRVTFAYPLRESTSQGYSRLIKIHPKLATTIYNYVMKITFPYLISKDSVASLLTISFRALINIEIPISYISEQLCLQFSLHLSHKDIEVRNAAADFVMMYHSKTQCASALHRLLAVMMTEPNRELRIRIMSTMRKKPCDGTAIYMLKTLIRDFSPEICLSSFEFLAKYCQIPEVYAILNNFLLEIINGLQHSPSITRQSINYFYVITQNAEKKGKIYSEYANKLISPFRIPILNILLNGKQRLPHVAISLMTAIIPYSNNNISLDDLTFQIVSNLSIQSKETRILAALNLLNAAIDNTTIVIDHNAEILSSLLTLTRRNFPKEFKETLIVSLSKLAAIKPSIYNDIKEKHKTAITPNTFFDQCEAIDPTQKMLYVCASMTLMALLDILSNNSLSQLHQLAIDALIKTLKSNRLLGNFVEDKLVGRYMEMLRQDSHSVLLLGSIPTLESSVSHQSFAPLLPLIIDSICQKWNTTEHSMFEQISTWLVHSMPEDMKPYMPRLVTVFLSDLSTIESILSTLVNFKSAISSVVHIIYPIVLYWIINNSDMVKTCEKVLEKFKVLVKNGGSQKYAVQIINTLVKTVQGNFALKKASIDVIFVVAVQMGSYFLLHIPSLSPTFVLQDYPKFAEYVRIIEENREIPPEILNEVTPEPVIPLPKVQPPSVKHNPVILDCPSSDLSSDEWEDWFEDLCQTLFTESSSRAISACYLLALRYVPMLNAIFPLAFSLLLTQVESSSKIVKTVLESDTTPQYIREYFLSVIENLELLNVEIPVDDSIIMKNCMMTKRFSQAMRATERLYEQNKDNETGNKLLEEYMLLGLRDAAQGLLNNVKPTPQASEKLGNWENALKDYTKMYNENEKDEESMLGMINCWWNLGKYDDILYFSKNGNLSLYICKVYTIQFDYNKLFEVMKRVDLEKMDSKFISIIHFLKNKNYQKVEEKVSEMRMEVGLPLLPTVSMDYKRNYEEFVKLTFAGFVEEVVSALRENNLQHLKRMNTYKFDVVNYSSDALLTKLLLLSFVYDSDDIKPFLIEYIKKTIEEKKFNACEIALNHFDHEQKNEEFNLLRCDLLWEMNKQNDAISFLTKIAKNVTSKKKLANWLILKNRNEEAKALLNETARLCQTDSEIWQYLTRVNFFLFEISNDEENLTDSFSSALKGLSLGFESLSLAIRVIQILFQHRTLQILKIFENSINLIPTNVWIVVLPQIIARIASKESDIADLLQKLVLKIGNDHPQPVLYSLLVPLEGDSKHRKKAALQISQVLAKTYPDSVNSMRILSHELMRVACTRFELCYNCIRDTLFEPNEFTTKYLHQLFEQNSKENETFLDVSFSREFGNLLNLLEEWVKKYEETKDHTHKNMIYNVMGQIWLKIKPIPSKMMSLDLKDVSPKLSSKENFKYLSVPGNYKNIVYMSKISQNLEIIESLHRPRKVKIYGDNGVEYDFLLKAHEDTRLDERVMQLFDFINTFSSQKKMRLSTYKVTPLTGNVGLIGWVPDCTTLANLIMTQRNRSKISNNREMESSFELAHVENEKEFYEIPLERRRKLFVDGQKSTKGDDLQQVLLLQSSNSSDWVTRRTQYAASLASTSMVGYVIGIGDRHLNNIMLDAKSGKLIHIDYSDCFEIRMHDSVFPETVPFRLTRILVNALEAKRIEGTFRTTSISIMRDMQSRGDQILALLEVFIYDPLLQWIPLVGSGHSSFGSPLPEGQGERSPSVETVHRIKDKLQRTDGDKNVVRSLEEQVDSLIKQACDPTNLCRMHPGWNPWL